MKTITISRNSWHWKLNEFYGWKSWQPQEFCPYVRRLIFCSLLTLMLGSAILTVIGLIVTIMLQCWWWALMCLVHWGCSPAKDLIPLGVGMTGLFAAVSFVIAVKQGWIRIPSIPLPPLHKWIPNCAKIPFCPETRDFIADAWITLYDKVCFKMDIKD